MNEANKENSWGPNSGKNKFSQRESGALGDMEAKVEIKAAALTYLYFGPIQMLLLHLLRILYGFLSMAH